jgi:hypothetical protein
MTTHTVDWSDGDGYEDPIRLTYDVRQWFRHSVSHHRFRRSLGRMV